MTTAVRTPTGKATQRDRRQFDDLADLVARQGLALIGARALAEPLVARDQRLLAAAGLSFSRMLDRRSERWRTRLVDATGAAGPEGLSRRQLFIALGGHAAASEVDHLVACLVGEGQLEQLRGPVSGGRRALLVRRPASSRSLA